MKKGNIVLGSLAFVLAIGSVVAFKPSARFLGNPHALYTSPDNGVTCNAKQCWTTTGIGNACSTALTLRKKTVNGTCPTVYSGHRTTTN